MVHNTATMRRACYERAINENPDRNDTVAMKMLLCEARKRERSQLQTAEERRKADIKWRFILTQVKEAERKGVSACDIRADLASRYPFQGMLTQHYLFKKELEMRDVVAEANFVISNSSHTSHTSSKCSTSNDSSSDKDGS